MGRVAQSLRLALFLLHELRHSYASRALALGEGLPAIGRLLGHVRVGTTAKYAHLVRDAEKAAAARTGDSIGAQILPGRARHFRVAVTPMCMEAVLAPVNHGGSALLAFCAEPKSLVDIGWKRSLHLTGHQHRSDRLRPRGRAHTSCFAFAIRVGGASYTVLMQIGTAMVLQQARIATTRLSVTLPQELYDQVIELATRNDTSAAWVIRRAVGAYCCNHLNKVMPDSNIQSQSRPE